jgi:hypothetical protein
MRAACTIIGQVNFRNGMSETVRFCTDVPLSEFAADKLPPEVTSVWIVDVIWE